MDKLRAAIRPMDVVLAALTSGLGVWLMVENMNATSADATRVDSHSWLLIPVWLLASLPVLLRRVNLPAVVLVTAAALAVHVAAFGWVVRCGAGLPLAFVLAYSAGRLLRDRTTSLVTLALTIGVQVLVLVRDSAAGLGIVPVTAILAVVFWGVGAFVRTRTERHADQPAPAVPVGSRA